MKKILNKNALNYKLNKEELTLCIGTLLFLSEVLL
jgi:hypothetical protein